MCNFVEIPTDFFSRDYSTSSSSDKGKGKAAGEGDAGAGAGADGVGEGVLRVIYRHYATLYFVFVVDESESELGILDLIQVSRTPPPLFSSPSSLGLGFDVGAFGGKNRSS